MFMTSTLSPPSRWPGRLLKGKARPMGASPGAPIGLAAPMGTIMEDGWVDDEDGPPECMHANNICITHVETLKKAFSVNDFVGAGYDSNESRGASPGPGTSPRQSHEDHEDNE